MIYLKNTLPYILTVEIPTENGYGKKITFNCYRLYTDTGNVASTGVTELSDADFEALQKIPAFQKVMASGQLVKTVKPEDTAMVLQSVQVENKQLKQEAEKKEAEVKKISETAKALENENASLKEQLAALRAKKTRKAE